MIVDTILQIWLHLSDALCVGLCMCVRTYARVYMCLANKLEEQTGSASLIKEPDTIPHFLSPICLPTNREIATLAETEILT